MVEDASMGSLSLASYLLVLLWPEESRDKTKFLSVVLGLFLQDLVCFDFLPFSINEQYIGFSGHGILEREKFSHILILQSIRGLILSQKAL